MSLSQLFQNIFPISQTESEILAAVIIFSLVALTGWIVYSLFGKYFLNWAKNTKSTLDDVILPQVKRIVILIIMILGVYYSLTSLSILQPYYNDLNNVFSVLAILLGAFITTRITSIIIDWYVKKAADRTIKSNHILFVLKKAIQIIVFIFAFLIILWVLNIDLTGVVVGLGVGGIAIAFALQSTLSDFFSAFSIYFDKPFEIGDFIIVGDYAGTVTNIGIKSTRIQLLQGEELIVANKELTASSIRNFKKLETRRVEFGFGVTYSTPSEKLKKIPQLIAEIIKKVDLATLDRIHFTEFGDYSLKFIVIYYAKTADYTKYLDIQQAINLAIKEEFEKEGIEMAFPTQTVYINK